MTEPSTPEQELSLLPGDYYHPEAEYEENYHDSGKTHLKSKGHKVRGLKHGVWEDYRLDGTTYAKRYHLRIK
jgi:hypothetical protein